MGNNYIGDVRLVDDIHSPDYIGDVFIVATISDAINFIGEMQFLAERGKNFIGDVRAASDRHSPNYIGDTIGETTKQYIIFTDGTDQIRKGVRDGRFVIELWDMWDTFDWVLIKSYE